MQGIFSILVGCCGAEPRVTPELCILQQVTGGDYHVSFWIIELLLAPKDADGGKKHWGFLPQGPELQHGHLKVFTLFQINTAFGIL